MFIGASPGSTGGGINTTSLAVLIAFVSSRARGRERIEWMGRSLPLELVAKAVTTAAAFTALIFLSVICIQIIEAPAGIPGGSRGLFLDHIFEVVSALGTVGLSTGITADLSGSVQILLAFLMFIGRLGPLLIADSLVGRKRSAHYTLPEERMMVG
jgi:trk system potassium uptake protein TrkH